MKAILTVGPSGSGKTTWARSKIGEGFSRANRDDIRDELSSGEYSRKGKWDWSRESEVSGRQRSLIKTYAEATRDVIIDDTNINVKFRRELITFLEGLGYEVEVIWFTDLTMQQCWNNIQKRRRAGGRRVPKDVLRKQFDQLGLARNFDLENRNERHGNNLTERVELPKAILVDIDNTICITDTKDRSPYDWSDLSADYLNTRVADVIQAYASSTGAKVLGFTARPENARKTTQAWLDEWEFNTSKLFMRKTGDNRTSDVVKREMMDNYIVGNYSVLCMFEDDVRVVDMMRTEFGLVVLQVGQQRVWKG